MGRTCSRDNPRDRPNFYAVTWIHPWPKLHAYTHVTTSYNLWPPCALYVLIVCLRSHAGCPDVCSRHPICFWHCYAWNLAEIDSVNLMLNAYDCSVFYILSITLNICALEAYAEVNHSCILGTHKILLCMDLSSGRCAREEFVKLCIVSRPQRVDFWFMGFSWQFQGLVELQLSLQMVCLMWPLNNRFPSMSGSVGDRTLTREFFIYLWPFSNYYYLII